MLDTIKTAAVAAILVFAILAITHYNTGAPVASFHSSPHASTQPPACSYDGNFDNDPPGCK
jgi:hypothetical protein